jgi:hypothetical protein
MVLFSRSLFMTPAHLAEIEARLTKRIVTTNGMLLALFRRDDIADLLALAKEQAAEIEQLKAQLSERAGSFKGHHRL